MRLLLDTHVVLWQLAGTRALGEHATGMLAGADELLFSVVSFAEIGVKVAVGKLVVPNDLGEQVRASGVRVLGLEPEDGLAVSALPLYHRDPFDRLLIVQARRNGLALVSADERMRAYDVAVVDPAT